jgi:hypothetical protein
MLSRSHHPSVVAWFGPAIHELTAYRWPASVDTRHKAGEDEPGMYYVL